MDAFLERSLPWWANNLFRFVVGLPFLPFLMLRFAVGYLIGAKAIFSGGSEIIGLPWEWDWFLGGDDWYA